MPRLSLKFPFFDPEETREFNDHSKLAIWSLKIRHLRGLNQQSINFKFSETNTRLRIWNNCNKHMVGISEHFEIQRIFSKLRSLVWRKRKISTIIQRWEFDHSRFLTYGIYLNKKVEKFTFSQTNTIAEFWKSTFFSL